MNFKLVPVACLGILTGMTGTAQAGTVTVATAAELQSAVATANNLGGNTKIVVRDGTYTLNDTLYVNVPNVAIVGQSSDRTKVIIQGDAMSSTAKVGNVIRVAASNFQLSNVTLQKSRWHLIQIAGETNADGLIIKNCILRDAYQQLLKVSYDPTNPSATSNNGLVENCIFEYSASVGPQYYIGGIDAHGAKDWVVRNNTFQNIISPNNTVAEFAVHFWDPPSSNHIVERNLILNCDRGIGFGMDGHGNMGGIIRNNMIYHASNKGFYADTSIALIESPDTQVYNNTIFMENDFPSAIEYRFTSTQNVLIANNLTNKPILSRDGATGTVTRNVTHASDAWFVNVLIGNLHLASAIRSVVDLGLPVSGLRNDFDNESRSQYTGIDIGADEFSSITNLTLPMASYIAD